MDSKSALLHHKNARVLVALKTDAKKWYASSLAKEAGLSYVYASEIIGAFEKDGLVEVKKEGKIRRVSLTENGAKVANALEELFLRLSAVSPAPAKEEKKEEKKI